MNPPTALSTERVRSLLRVLHEAYDDHAPERRSRLLRGLCRLLRASAAVAIIAERFRAGTTARIRSIMAVEHAGGPRAIPTSQWSREIHRDNPAALELARRVERSPSPEVLCCTRDELVHDALWYDSPFVAQERRPLRLDHTLYGVIATSTPGVVVCMGFLRSWGEDAFQPGDRALLEVVASECRTLLAKDDGSPREALAPQPRVVLDHLLSGASEKETAARMGLSCHTVHQYVKLIYRAYGVRSRPELMASCLGRPMPLAG